MKLTPSELKDILNISTIIKLDFDNLGKLRSKNGKKILSFLENEKHLPTLLSNKSINAVFTTKKLSKKIGRRIQLIISTNPKYDFGKLHNYLCSNTDFYKNKISWKTNISSDSIINSENISKDYVSIEAGTKIETGSVVNESVKIGNNVKISPNVVIGEDGEEFAKKGDKILRLIFDGGVIIEDNVKIQSNVSIKRGIFGSNTVIAQGTTIGSFVNIGHDVIVGKNCYLTPGTIIAGSCKIGNNCLLGVNSTVKNGIKIGNNCVIGAGTVVTTNIPSNKVVVGVPGKIIRKAS